MDPVETRYFINPSGAPVVADIYHDEHTENPEDMYDEIGTLVLYSDDFRKLPWLSGAVSRWVGSDRDGVTFEGAQMLRYIRGFHSDKVRMVCLLNRQPDYALAVDFDSDDSGYDNGLLVLTHDDVREFSGGDPAWATDEKIREYMTARIATYSAWVTGDTYMITTRTFSAVGLDEPDESETVGGYYGLADARSATREYVDDGAREVTEQEYEQHVQAACERRRAVDTSDLDDAIASAAGERRERLTNALTWI